MNRLSFPLAAALTVIGCSSTTKITNGHDGGDGAGQGCTSVLVGDWVGVTKNDEAVISSDSSIRYTGADGCIASGTYACPDPTITKGSVQVSIGASSGGECPAVSTASCTFEINGASMTYSCEPLVVLQFRRK